MAISLYTSFVHLDDTAKACLLVTGIAIVLRLWTRKWILNKIGFDDWAMIASWCCFCTCCGLLIWLVGIADEVYHGRPYADVVHTIGRLLLASKLLYIASMALLKVSLAAFFLHIFYIYPIHRAMILTIAALTVIYSIVCIGVTSGTCGDYAGFLGDQCVSGQGRAYVGVNISWSAFNAAGDLIFSALAVDALRRVQMRPSTKIYAMLVLLLGTAGGIFSIVRLALITTETLGNDSESGEVMTIVWTVLEMSIGLIAINLACLRPMLRALRRRFSKKDGSDPYIRPVVQRYNARTPGYGTKTGPEPLTLMSALDGKPIELLSKDWTAIESGAGQTDGPDGSIAVVHTTVVSTQANGNAQAP